MIKNSLKLSIVTAVMITTNSFAGSVTAPNSMDISLSGDVKFKAVSEKTGSNTIQKRTADVNLGLESKLKNGTKIFTSFVAYDDAQGGVGASTALTTKEAYAMISIMNGKAKIIAGLAPDKQYGTQAFDNGGESWKLGVFTPIAKGVKLGIVSYVKNEEQKNKNKGDTGANAIRIDTMIGSIKAGLKYGQKFANKGDGFVVTAGQPDKKKTEFKINVITGYIQGNVSGVNLGFEFEKSSVDMVGAPKNPKDPKGYFLTADKTIDNLKIGLSYIKLQNAMKGGGDFAPGMILDGNIAASATKDTSAIVLPIEYTVNSQITANATYIKADIQGKDASEIDLGVGYVVDDNIELSAGFGKYTIDGSDNQTNLEVAIAITF